MKAKATPTPHVYKHKVDWGHEEDSRELTLQGTGDESTYEIEQDNTTGDWVVKVTQTLGFFDLLSDAVAAAEEYEGTSFTQQKTDE